MRLCELKRDSSQPRHGLLLCILVGLFVVTAFNGGNLSLFASSSTSSLNTSKLLTLSPLNVSSPLSEITKSKGYTPPNEKDSGYESSMKIGTAIVLVLLICILLYLSIIPEKETYFAAKNHRIRLENAHAPFLFFDSPKPKAKQKSYNGIVLEMNLKGALISSHATLNLGSEIYVKLDQLNPGSQTIRAMVNKVHISPGSLPENEPSQLQYDITFIEQNGQVHHLNTRFINDQKSLISQGITAEAPLNIPLYRK